MTDQFMFWFLALERDDEGRPKPPEPERSGFRRHFKTFLFYQGIHDPARVARLCREWEKGRAREMG